MLYSLRQVQFTLDFVENLGLEVKWHGRGDNEAAHYCNVCEVMRVKLFYSLEPHHEKTCFFAYPKIKAQISSEVTAQLISAFVFATVPLLRKSEISSL